MYRSRGCECRLLKALHAVVIHNACSFGRQYPLEYSTEWFNYSISVSVRITRYSTHNCLPPLETHRYVSVIRGTSPVQGNTYRIKKSLLH